MPFQILRNDITDMAVDAIVNTANPRPKIGYGVDSGIHKKAGPGLLAARMLVGNIPVGGAAITKGYRLKAKHVIHTVGPVWQGGTMGEEALLRSCYTRCLEIAVKNKCASIAFPLISAGNLGFPKAMALQIALGAIEDFLVDHELEVSLVVFDRDAFRLSETLFQDVSSYIDENYVKQKNLEQYGEDATYPTDVVPQTEVLWYKMQQRRLEVREEHACSPPNESRIDCAPTLPASMPASPAMQENSVLIPLPKASAPSAAAPKEAKKERAQQKKQAQKKTEPIPFRQKQQSQQDLRGGIASTADTFIPVCDVLASTEANFWSAPTAPAPPTDYGAIKLRLEDLLRQEDAGFSETLLRLIDKTGKKDSEIYSKANVSRQHFSKIKNNPDYKPSKPTAIAFAIALELDMEQTIDLIGRAGYALTRSSKFDLIIMYFIQKKNYNLFDINATLFEFDQHLLGA